MKNLKFRSSARAPSQGSGTIGTSDPNMGVGYEVPLGCLCVAGEEYENFDFLDPKKRLYGVCVWGVSRCVCVCVGGGWECLDQITHKMKKNAS